ncbi:four helix bundle protein [Psychroflexus aurantiacus]|uniref:four helix bundle protein n=1 Tax=Psychroflexus aurantiacus TaxID=2709310 RepID=UPI001F3BFF0A|nr:four helix bundle protein [Psychroflexus aurantiacus]
MATQLFKSNTSRGANIREAQNAETKAGFIHKFKIAANEANETKYWLELCKTSNYYLAPKEILLMTLRQSLK